METTDFIPTTLDALKIHCHDVESEVNVSADEFYYLLKNNMTDFTLIFPEIFKSVEVLEGDGKSVGSVRLWKYCLGGSTDVLEVKETLKVVDDEKRSLTLSVLEGSLLNQYKSFDVTVSVTPKEGAQETVSLVKWSLACGNDEGQENPSPDAYKDVLVALNELCSSHLLNLPL